jgi:hypothetical protein
MSSWFSWISSTISSTGTRVVNWLNENNIEVQLEYYDGAQRYRRVISGPNRQEEFVPVEGGSFIASLQHMTNTNQNDSPIFFQSTGMTDDLIEETCAVVDYAPGQDSSTSCTICMEDFQPGERVRILPCFHHYHVACIDQWLREHPQCPVCKFSLVTT